ncbi:MAG: hypothetical protein R2877_02495 [Bdellovibrionota bacterium]
MSDEVKKEVLSIYRLIYTSSGSNTIYRDKYLLTFEHYFSKYAILIYTLPAIEKDLLE